MVAYRIADSVILRLIGKWLNAGAIQDGVVICAEEGTPTGRSDLTRVEQPLPPFCSRFVV
jgi:hypothetical protein